MALCNDPVAATAVTRRSSSSPRQLRSRSSKGTALARAAASDTIPAWQPALRYTLISKCRPTSHVCSCPRGSTGAYRHCWTSRTEPSRSRRTSAPRPRASLSSRSCSQYCASALRGAPRRRRRNPRDERGVYPGNASTSCSTSRGRSVRVLPTRTGDAGSHVPCRPRATAKRKRADYVREPCFGVRLLLASQRCTDVRR
jgi:hypothetical protein